MKILTIEPKLPNKLAPLQDNIIPIYKSKNTMISDNLLLINDFFVLCVDTSRTLFKVIYRYTQAIATIQAEDRIVTVSFIPSVKDKFIYSTDNLQLYIVSLLLDSVWIKHWTTVLRVPVAISSIQTTSNEAHVFGINHQGATIAINVESKTTTLLNTDLDDNIDNNTCIFNLCELLVQVKCNGGIELYNATTMERSLLKSWIPHNENRVGFISLIPGSDSSFFALTADNSHKEIYVWSCIQKHMYLVQTISLLGFKTQNKGIMDTSYTTTTLTMDPSGRFLLIFSSEHSSVFIIEFVFEDSRYVAHKVTEWSLKEPVYTASLTSRVRKQAKSKKTDPIDLLLYAKHSNSICLYIFDYMRLVELSSVNLVEAVPETLPIPSGTTVNKETNKLSNITLLLDTVNEDMKEYIINSLKQNNEPSVNTTSKVEPSVNTTSKIEPGISTTSKIEPSVNTTSKI